MTTEQSNNVVSVIIANWNGAEHLRVCLPSLRAQSYGAIEIVVVDNASSDDSAAVGSEFGVTWLQLKENIGLGRALNRGAQVASGRFLLFVNNDMRFDERFVSLLVQHLICDEAIFAVDGMQYNWDGNVRGHMASRLVRGKAQPGATVELVPGLNFRQEDRRQITPVFMGSAASMLVRRSYFEDLGGFDNDIPLGYEDAHLCWRAWIRGWKTLYAPDAVCWHRVGSSCRSSEGSLFLFVGVLKGRLAFATKLLPVRYALLTWLTSVGGLAKDVGRLRWRFAWNRIKVLTEFGVNIPRFLRAKRALFRKSRTTPAEQLEHMLRLSCDAQIVEASWSGHAEKSATGSIDASPRVPVRR